MSYNKQFNFKTEDEIPEKVKAYCQLHCININKFLTDLIKDKLTIKTAMISESTKRYPKTLLRKGEIIV